MFNIQNKCVGILADMSVLFRICANHIQTDKKKDMNKRYATFTTNVHRGSDSDSMPLVYSHTICCDRGLNMNTYTDIWSTIQYIHRYTDNRYMPNKELKICVQFTLVAAKKQQKKTTHKAIVNCGVFTLCYTAHISGISN